MNTRKIALASISLLLVSAVSTSAEARDRVDRRQGHQSHRVHEGMTSGEITPVEAARLRESKRAIRRTEKRAESDGVVTGHEQARLERMQDARSRQINRVKHNDRQNPTAPIPQPGTETSAAPVDTTPEVK